MEVEPLEYEGENFTLRHVQGYKDEYKVEMEVESGFISPTNEEIFALLHMWYVSEEAAYSDGFGRKMPWFYNTLCSIDRNGYEKAKEANQVEGRQQLKYFEASVDEYADDIITMIEDLKEEVKDA